MQRMTWDEIRRRKDCRGRWVALHECRYDAKSGRAAEGELVDTDDDLASLCERVTEAEYRNCAILYCETN
ncbi:MAG: hypothetical protein ACOCV4_04955 [Myxococcota bacterium]